MVFFWACEVTETKAAVVKIPADYVLNVCHATLASAATDGIVSVGIEAPQMDASLWKGVVAHLGAAAHAHQVKLDLVVGGGAAQVKFYVAKGTGKVNLTGYFQPGPPADLVGDHEEVPTAVDSTPAKSKKRAREEKKKQTPVTWDQDAGDSEDSDDEKPTPAAAEPAQKQLKKDDPKQKTGMPPQQQNGTSGGAQGEAKKRKKHKNKGKNKEKKDEVK